VPATTPYRDSLIAATAAAHGLIVVARNVADFRALRVAVVNPWDLTSPVTRRPNRASGDARYALLLIGSRGWR